MERRALSTQAATLRPVHGTAHARAHARVPLESSLVSLQNRSLPSLLDRLTDDAPEQREEALSRRFVSHGTLRKAVLRDLCWLFNCVSNDCLVDLDHLPQVARSTFNFGMVALAGRHVSGLDWKSLEKSLTAAILHFEPRILPADLEVRCLSASNALDLHNVLQFEIRGRLAHSPVPLPFVFRTEIDLESGHFDLKESR